MSVRGHQDFWLTGQRFYFQQRPSGNTRYPLLDMGVVTAASPTIETNSPALQDPDGGRLKVVERGTASIEEKYSVTLANLSLETRRFAFLGSDPEDVVRTATLQDEAMRLFPGRLAKIVDGDGQFEVGLRAIAGVYVPAAEDEVPAVQAAEVVDMSVGSQTITTATDPSTYLNVGDRFIVDPTDLENPANGRTYEVQSLGATSIVVAATTPIVADEAAVGADILYSTGAGNVAILAQDVDWEVLSIDRGLARVLPGGSVATETLARCIYQHAALTGQRRFVPQAADRIEGSGMLVWGREGNQRQGTRRIPLLAINPAGLNLSADQFSDVTLEITVLKDDTQANPVGDVFDFKGDVPSLS